MSGSDIECFLETIRGAAFFDCFRKAVEQAGAHSQCTNAATRGYNITKRFTYNQAFLTKRKTRDHTHVILQSSVVNNAIYAWLMVMNAWLQVKRLVTL